MPYRRPGASQVLYDSVTSLLAVTGPSDGVALAAPFTLGVAGLGDTQRAVPSSAILTVRGQPGQTVTIAGPVAIKGLVDGVWIPLGQLQAGAATVVLTDSAQVGGLLRLPAQTTRVAIVAAGAVVGGGVTATVTAEVDSEVIQ